MTGHDGNISDYKLALPTLTSLTLKITPKESVFSDYLKGKINNFVLGRALSDDIRRQNEKRLEIGRGECAMIEPLFKKKSKKQKATEETNC